MAKSGITSELKFQGKAALLMVGIAIAAVMGMVVLIEFQDVVHGMEGLGNSSGEPTTTNLTVTTAITAFTAGLAIFGTFAVVTALIIVVKAI